MINKIPCATDGEPHSDIPISLAAQRAAKFGCKLSIIAVNILAMDDRAGSYTLWTEVVDRAAEVAKTAGFPGADTVPAIGRDPAAVIVDYAEKNGFDHFIVGNPRIGVARLILGSVAAEVGAKAHCSVTITR
jgi:nucleotide-binding universal stress UspA family protein